MPTRHKWTLPVYFIFDSADTLDLALKTADDVPKHCGPFQHVMCCGRNFQGQTPHEMLVVFKPGEADPLKYPPPEDIAGIVGLNHAAEVWCDGICLWSSRAEQAA